MLRIRAELIVASAFLGIAEHLVGFVDLLKSLLSCFLVFSRVRMVKAREFAECGFDFGRSCGFRDSEDSVVIAIMRGPL